MAFERAIALPKEADLDKASLRTIKCFSHVEVPKNQQGNI